MKTRTMICIMMIICMICGITEAGGERAFLQLECQTPAGTIQETMNVFIEEKEITILSSQFPSYAIRETLTEEMEKVLPFKSEIPAFSDIQADQLIKELKTLYKPVRTEGVYAGDAFEEASVMETMTIQMHGFLQILMNAFPEAGLAQILKAIALDDIAYTLRIYDDGKAFSLAGKHGEDTFFTLSADCSRTDGFFAVAGTAENGKNYYWVIQTQRADEYSHIIAAKLLADAEKSGYRSISQTLPILTEIWQIQKEKERSAYQFKGTVTPGNGMAPVLISGTVDGEKPEQLIQAQVSFRDHDRLTMKISAGLDSEKISSTELNDKKILQASAMSAVENETLISEIQKESITLMASLVLSLPEGYMNLLIDQQTQSE